jgi:hypothetical protein
VQKIEVLIGSKIEKIGLNRKLSPEQGEIEDTHWFKNPSDKPGGCFWSVWEVGWLPIGSKILPINRWLVTVKEST